MSTFLGTVGIAAVITLSFPSSTVLAQQQPETKSTATAPVTVADLANLLITTVDRYQGMFRHARGEGPGRIEVRTEITLGPEGAISWRTTRNVAAETPKGTKNASLSRSGQGKIGTPGKVSDGSGDMLWVIDGSALVRMRTMASGGHLHRISLARTGSGWTCKSNAPFAREVGGGGQLKDRAAMPGGGQVEMLNITQTGSSCTVTKK